MQPFLVFYSVPTRLASLFPGFTASSGTFPDYLEEQVAKHQEATKGWPEDKVTWRAGAGRQCSLSVP